MRPLIDAASILFLGALASSTLAGCSFIYDFEQPLVLPADADPPCIDDDDCDDEIDCTVRICRDQQCITAPGGDTRDVDEDGYVGIDCGGDDCDDTDRLVYPGAPERCNAIDDNCSGTPNDVEPVVCIEGDIGSACTTECDTTGEYRCTSECAWECEPPTEECNGLDEDCDGQPDNGFSCVQNTESPCPTACGTTGTSICDGDCEFIGACQPPPESCNGGDDDCDELIDEANGVRLTFATLHYPTLPVAVWNGDGYGVAFADSRDIPGGSEMSQSEAYFLQVDAQGQLIEGSEQRLTNQASPIIGIDMVWTGEEYLLVYADKRRGLFWSDLFMNRIDPDGRVTAADIPLTEDDSLAYDVFPALAWSGSVLGMAFADQFVANKNVYFTILDETGARPSTWAGDIEVSSDQAIEPDIVWADDRFVVVWVERTRDGGLDEFQELFYAAYDETGTQVTPTTRLTDTNSNSRAPDVAWHDGSLLVTWRENAPSPRDETMNQIHYALFTLTPGPPVTGTPVGSEFDSYDNELLAFLESAPSVAWDGTQWIITWNDSVEVDYTGSVYALSVTADGSSHGVAHPLTDDVGIAAFPNITWNESGGAIVWIDDRHDSCIDRGEALGCYSWSEIYFALAPCHGE